MCDYSDALRWYMSEPQCLLRAVAPAARCLSFVLPAPALLVAAVVAAGLLTFRAFCAALLEHCL